MDILIDPGHGLYLTTEGVWSFQRPEWRGYVEDTGVQVLAMYLYNALINKGYTVFSTRPIKGTDVGESIGKSGEPRWKEAAIYYLREVMDGHPTYKEKGWNEYARDVNCRPFHANYRNPALVISLHSNASDSNPDAHGFSVWHRADDEVSNELAADIEEMLLKDAARYDIVSRGLKGNDPGWENSRAKELAIFKRTNVAIPTVLLEYLFHSNKKEVELLKDPNILARAAMDIGRAIDQFLKGRGAP